jgi:hypothetical protein
MKNEESMGSALQRYIVASLKIEGWPGLAPRKFAVKNSGTDGLRESKVPKVRSPEDEEF